MAGLIVQNAMRERNSVEVGKSKSLEAIHKVPECRNDVCGSAPFLKRDGLLPKPQSSPVFPCSGADAN